MKPTLIGPSGLVALGNAAFAQYSASSFGVNLFGTLDADVRAVKNGNFKVAELSGQSIHGALDSTAGGDRKQKLWQLGAGLIRADYIHGDMSGGQFGLGRYRGKRQGDDR